MRTKVTLVLIFLNVALFFFIFKFERDWRTDAAALEARRRVLGFEAADIRSLDISTGPNGVPISLVRKRDTWFLTKPLDWPANPFAISSIVHELQLLENETSFSTKDLAKTNMSLADYGLDKPKMTVAFTSGDPAAGNGPPAPTILRIGDTTKVSNRLYILSPNGDRIHVVNRSLIDSLALPLEQLRADTLLTIPFYEAQSLAVQTASPDQARGGAAAGPRVRIRRDTPQRWSFETPITAPASQIAIELTINQLNALHAKNFVATPVGALPSVSPTLRIALDGNQRQQILFLGEPVTAKTSAAAPVATESAAKPAPGDPARTGTAPSAAAPQPNEVEYFAQLEGRSAVFTVVVPNELTKVLRDATNNLREKRILDFNPEAVSTITLGAPVQSNQAPVTLQRLESAANATTGGAWQVVQRGEGNQGLRTMPADGGAVQRLLSQLSRLAASAFVSESPSSADLEGWGFNRPEREITLTLATVPPALARPATAQASAASNAANATLILRLGTDAAGKVFARVGNASDPGSSIYALEGVVPSDFPIGPAAWRDRLLPAVPANARVSAVKLTDLASHQTLLESTLDVSGQPVAPVRDPKALREVIARFRTLRVKSFRSEHFAERVQAAGEERPWRYELDVVISLPGGTDGEQAETKSLYLLERGGGAEQVAGSKEFDAIFELEQPFLDALWNLTYGPRDPGPPSPAGASATKEPAAK